MIYSHKPISRLLTASRLIHFRSLSQKADSNNEANVQDKKTSSILGFTQGLGLAGEVLKKQEETSSTAAQAKPDGQQDDSDEEAKRKKEAEASWRAMKYTLYFFGFTMTALSGFVIAVWGAPEKDEHGNVIEDQFSSKPLALQYLLRSWNAIMNYSKVISKHGLVTELKFQCIT